MMVDPAFVTLGSVPFLLIRGLPRVAALQACFIDTPMNSKYSTATNNDQNSPLAYYTTGDNITNVALGVKIGPGVQCLMALPYRLPTNITLLDSSGNVPHGAQAIIQHSLVSTLPFTKKSLPEAEHFHTQNVFYQDKSLWFKVQLSDTSLLQAKQRSSKDLRVTFWYLSEWQGFS